MNEMMIRGVRSRQTLIRENPERFNEDERAWAEEPATDALAAGNVDEAERLRRESEEPAVPLEPSRPLDLPAPVAPPEQHRVAKKKGR